MANTTTDLPHASANNELPNVPKTSTNSASTNDAEVHARIQALPQELQDNILSLTDCFHIPTTVALNELYYPNPRSYTRVSRRLHRPPVGLHLNRKFRAKFEKAYYSTVIFKWTTTHFSSISDLDEWYASLNTAQQEILTCIQITRPMSTEGYYEHDPAWILEDTATVRRCVMISREVKLVFGTEVKLRTREGDKYVVGEVINEFYDEKGTRLPEGWPLA